MTDRVHNVRVAVTEKEFEKYTISARFLNKSNSQLIRDAVDQYLNARKAIIAPPTYDIYSQKVNENDLAVVGYYTPTKNFMKPGWYLAIRKDGGDKLDYIYYFHGHMACAPSYTQFIRALMQYILDED